MITLPNRLAAALAAVAIVALPFDAAAGSNDYRGVYGKSEVDKASSKCVATLAGGALLGAGLGAMFGGRKGAGIGALAGGAAGATICAVLISNAKHKDKIMQAQAAAASRADGTYSTSWNDDKGNPVAFTAQASATRQVDGSRLVPVRYQTADGSQVASTSLETGGRDCRDVSGSFANAKGNAPAQLYCRTPAGDYEPYEMAKS